MSGGHFNYNQYYLNDIADILEIDVKCAKSGEPDEYGYVTVIPDDILEKMEETMNELRIVQKKVHRIDWFLSGDDGEDSFRERWIEDLGL